MSARLDELAEALGRARLAHEKFPDDVLRQLRFEEARANYLDEQIKLIEAEKRQAVNDAAKAMAKAATAVAESASLREEIQSLKAGISGRIRAVIDRRAETVKAKRRRAPTGAAPLLEGVN